MSGNEQGGTAVPEAKPVKAKRRAHIGSYVLESLTTGMYGEPRHAIREYVQNAFDAIRLARGNGTLNENKGTIIITVDDAERTISIRDDGTGIRSAAAWGTLSAVGASTKDRTEQAGFRGIGRLAGLAYCEKLRFITKHRSDPIEATISFDCDRLRRGMDPTQDGGIDIQTLLTDAIDDEYREVLDAEKEDHYTEVILEDTKLAPNEITDVQALTSYLSQTAPVDFHPKLWPYIQKIQIYAEAQGETLETVQLVMRHCKAMPEQVVSQDSVAETGTIETDASTPVEYQIYKPYRATHVPKGRAPVSVADVQLIADQTGAKRWWGWIGQMPILGSLADEDAAGLRIRMRNIQIDGIEVTDRLFSDIRASYDRLNTWFIGEFHILSDDVVPNARRDSFEENKAWRDIQDDLRPHLKLLVKDTYKDSRSRNAKIRDLKRKVNELTDAVEQKLASPTTFDGSLHQKLLLQVGEVTERLGKEVAKDLVTEDEAKTIRLLQATVNESRRRLEKAVPVDSMAFTVSEARQNNAIMKSVYAVLQELLEPTLYRDVRREIERRINSPTGS